MRTNFEMTEADLDELLKAMRPTPMIALQCGTPRSVQENANAAWAVLGKKMGFDPMTVQPTNQGDRLFTAVAVPPEKVHVQRDGASWRATAPGFINLQESPAGFGDTPEEAIADLKAQGERNAD